VLDTYRNLRIMSHGKHEAFIGTLRRVGVEPFKVAANSARFAAASATKATASPAEQAA